MIVVLIIGVLLLIAVPQWRTVRERSQINACKGNRARIDTAKQSFILGTGADQSASPGSGDLTPAYIKEYPTCPASGTYTIGTGATPVTCTIHGT